LDHSNLRLPEELMPCTIPRSCLYGSATTYEHIIRNEDDLLRIRKYIVTNPATWLSDENHPSKAVE
jgi:hypothetical protein